MCKIPRNFNYFLAQLAELFVQTGQMLSVCLSVCLLKNLRNF